MIGCCGNMAWLMILGGILATGLVVALVLGIVWLARRSTRSVASTETPLETLKRRLAEGEVTPEQFENMKRQLGEEERRP